MTDKQIKEQLELIRRSNELLKEQNEKLIALNEEKNKVISIVSHELKSPLNRVFGLINLIKMTGDNLTEDQINYIDKVHLVVSEGLSLIRNMLDLQSIEERRIKMKIEAFDVFEILSDLVKDYELIADKKDISIRITGNNNLPRIHGDKLLVKRIFENILSNAVKYTRVGGAVEVKLGPEDSKYLQVSITDQGFGIKDEKASKIFQKFSVLGSTPTGGESSHGLGLAIVNSLVKKLNGKVWFESELEKGSEFFVSLPVSEG